MKYPNENYDASFIFSHIILVPWTIVCVCVCVGVCVCVPVTPVTKLYCRSTKSREELLYITALLVPFTVLTLRLTKRYQLKARAAKV